MLKSKIHRATVTQADLHYVGSVTVDEDLMDAADLLPGEQVEIVDITNGARLETYVIPGPRGSRRDRHQRRGCAARAPGRPRDHHRATARVRRRAGPRSYRPSIVHVDAANPIIELGADPAAAPDGLVGDPTRGDAVPVG